MPMAANTTAKLLTVAEHLRLTRDLRGELRVGQTGAGEDGQLLAADEGVQSVDGGNAGLDELGGVSRGRRGSWADR